MTTHQFKQESLTLKNFFELNCHDNHTNQTKLTYPLPYNGDNHSLELHLCGECHNLITYAFDRLTKCHYEIKPKCRSCSTVCYEKEQWKRTAKLMRYSGVKLGLTRIRNFIKKFI